MKRKRFVQVLAMSIALALGSLAATPAAAGGEYHQKHYQQEYRHDRRPAQKHRWVNKQHPSKSVRHGHYRHQGGNYSQQGRNRYDKGYNRGYKDARDRYDDNDDLGLALVTGLLLSNVIFY